PIRMMMPVSRNPAATSNSLQRSHPVGMCCGSWRAGGSTGSLAMKGSSRERRRRRTTPAPYTGSGSGLLADELQFGKDGVHTLGLRGDELGKLVRADVVVGPAVLLERGLPGLALDRFHERREHAAGVLLGDLRGSA